MSEWRKCTTCKKVILYSAPFWICNVSTCQRKRTGLVFCSVDCWDAHVPVFRHKDSWAEERRAPSVKEWAEVQAGTRPDPTYPPREKPQEEEPAPQKKAPTGPPMVIRRRGSP